MIPGLIVPVFFFGVNVGALEGVSQFAGVDDFKAFQNPVALVFAVTGVSRAAALVTDINIGYFDRLLVSPVNRFSLLIGLMLADVATAAKYNPITYLLDGLRAIISEGWVASEILGALGAVAALAAISMPLAFTALRAHVHDG